MFPLSPAGARRRREGIDLPVPPRPDALAAVRCSQCRQDRRPGHTSPKKGPVLATLFPLTTKPVLYVADVAEDGVGPNPPAEAVETKARAEGAAAVRVSAAVEAELVGLDEAERTEYLGATDAAGRAELSVVGLAMATLICSVARRRLSCSPSGTRQ